MSDDVEARFASVRVSYQQGDNPCRSARFTMFLCEREQPILCSHEFEVCVLGRLSDVFVVKGDSTENCFSLPEFEKISVPASPANRRRSSEQSQELKCWRTIHCERPSACRWHVSQVVARSSYQSRFANFHKSSGNGTSSTCRLARFTSGSSARDPPAQKPSGTFLSGNKRLPCVVRVRSAWRCATPCCLPALPFQRGMPLP